MSKHKAPAHHPRTSALAWLAVGIVALLASSTAIVIWSAASSDAVAPPRSPITPGVTLEPRPKPVVEPTPPPAPEPTGRTIRIAATAGPGSMQGLLDRCIGAIQINWAGHTPEIAQHDHCGGAWFASVGTGEVITVQGGSLGGTYRVNGNRRVVGKGASVSSIDGLGDVVLQTCVRGGLSLVGLQRIG